MREISVFDIIGPVMTGPSSSHTAGALRIARIAAKLATHRIVKAEFKLYGSFARTYKGHGTDRALVAGILGLDTDDERIKDSFSLARERGLDFSFSADESENDFHPNTVEITAISDIGSVLDVRGSSIGGGEVEITSINGTEISFSGRYSAVIITQRDEPGVIASITDIFNEHGINIAFMRVYREGMGGGACSVIEIDGDPDPEFVEDIRELSSVLSVRYFRMQGREL